VPYLWIILGMAVVTAVPRVLPAFLPSEMELPSWVRRWLAAVPYAALGALIFPGILSVDPSRPWVGLLGGLGALLPAWKGMPLGASLAAAVAVVYALQWLLH